MPYAHFAARSTPGFAPFEEFAAASWTWNRLREVFGGALAAVLMPNHVQLVVEVDDIAAARCRLSRTLGHLQRWWAPGREVWERVRMPKIVPGGSQLARELRYIALNPTRARLCSDPLEWPWTTHRDVMGAVVDPWVSVERFARTIDPSSKDLRARWHAYVSGDPSVAIEGTAVPQPAVPARVAVRPLHECVCAAAAALRVPASRLRAHADAPGLFLAVAREQGWNDSAMLAAAIGMSPRHVRRELTVDPEALRAANLCLGDRRLWAPFADDQPVKRRAIRFSGASRPRVRADAKGG